MRDIFTYKRRGILICGGILAGLAILLAVIPIRRTAEQIPMAELDSDLRDQWEAYWEEHGERFAFEHTYNQWDDISSSVYLIEVQTLFCTREYLLIHCTYTEIADVFTAGSAFWPILLGTYTFALKDGSLGALQETHLKNGKLHIDADTNTALFEDGNYWKSRSNGSVDVAFDAQYQIRDRAHKTFYDIYVKGAVLDSDVEPNKTAIAEISWEGDISFPFLMGSTHVKTVASREYVSNLK